MSLSIRSGERFGAPSSVITEFNSRHKIGFSGNDTVIPLVLTGAVIKKIEPKGVAFFLLHLLLV